jgi:hypothetical protein
VKTLDKVIDVKKRKKSKKGLPSWATFKTSYDRSELLKAIELNRTLTKKMTAVLQRSFPFPFPLAPNYLHTAASHLSVKWLICSGFGGFIQYYVVYRIVLGNWCCVDDGQYIEKRL